MGWEEESPFPLSLSEKECSCMSMIKRAYRYRCYPADEQQQILARTFGCARWIYNWALARKSQAYQEGKHLSYGDLSASLPGLKQQPETAWLAEVSSVTLQQSLRHLERAFVNFFEGRTHYPRFKSKKRDTLTATYTASAFTWRVGTLTLAKMGTPLDIRWPRLIAGFRPRRCARAAAVCLRACTWRFVTGSVLSAASITIGMSMRLNRC